MHADHHIDYLTFLSLEDLIESQLGLYTVLSTLSFNVSYISTRPHENRHYINLLVLIAFVRKSARLFFIWIFCISNVPSSIFSLTKWYWTLICFVFEWNAGFLARCKALWLSQYREMFTRLCSSSASTIFNHTTSLLACVAARSGLYRSCAMSGLIQIMVNIRLPTADAYGFWDISILSSSLLRYILENNLKLIGSGVEIDLQYCMLKRPKIFFK